MVGLHCCGDLTPTVLRLFASGFHPSLRSLVLLSCCYHKMSAFSKNTAGAGHTLTHTHTCNSNAMMARLGAIQHSPPPPPSSFLPTVCCPERSIVFRWRPSFSNKCVCTETGSTGNKSKARAPPSEPSRREQ